LMGSGVSFLLAFFTISDPEPRSDSSIMRLLTYSTAKLFSSRYSEKQLAVNMLCM